MILDYKFYSFVLEQDVIVEATIYYKEPDSSSDISDLDYFGYCDIMSLDVYHENSEPYISNNEYKNKQLDNEIREHLRQQIRLLEISDSRFEDITDKEFERYYIGDD